ncbi:uncharacterized protein LOC130778196 isoform X3 [Actinidia eriantha]|uniref:uncharacterized protein LOC130778196 isoform X3 n=1 Tax=Actinidia eriantha TaxID=165200 RepID=UPI00258367B6|nr:uncharacterized protein LOC130778196 isoform X3 [Actinidia eriantha]XP_057492675.1 uncharacterized protein LOC130778196 isoform X3 [Actinidia eriantha]
MDRQLVLRKPRFLCLHGFRSSGKILQTEIQQWPDFVLEKMDLVFVDAPFPAEGKSGLDGKFDPPYYEWFQSKSNEDYSEYRNFDECVAYIDECMTRMGPFDGLLGFSQGALLSAVLPGMQAQGVALTRVPKIKFVIVISGGKFGGFKFSSPKLAENSFSSPIECPSLHVYGEDDIAKPYATELLDSFSFVDPFVIHHHEGHVIPKLDEKGLEVMLSFIEKIQGVGGT